MISDTPYPGLRPLICIITTPNQHAIDSDALKVLHTALVFRSFGTGAVWREQKMGFASTMNVIVGGYISAFEASNGVLGVG